MLTNYKIIFDRYFWHNFCTNERNNGALHVYFTASSHFRVKAVIHMLVPGGAHLLIVSTRFTWRPVTSINKCGVSTARAHAKCHIYTWLIYGC